MPRVTMSFEKRRRVLLTRMTAGSSGQTIEKKVIRFRNDDVPQFLRELDKAENEARRSKLMVK